MYSDLYHEVMKSKSPVNQGHHRPQFNNKTNSFNAYKDSWNQMQDKIDKDYQKRLRQMNHQAQKRMQEAESKL